MVRAEHWIQLLLLDQPKNRRFYFDFYVQRAMSKRFDYDDVLSFEPVTVMNRVVVDRRIRRDRAELECRVNSVDEDEAASANDDVDFVADWESEVDELLADDEEEETLANENEIGD